MPRNRSSGKPRPTTMTWRKALPILAIAGVFDALRFVFEQFWFFGPALVGVAAGAATGSTLLGTAARTVAGGAEFFTGPALEAFGIVMAMAVGLLGSLVVNLLLVLTDGRIFKEHPLNFLWALFGLGVSVAPIAGTAPALSTTTWKMYHTQIKAEKKKLKQWEKEQEETKKRERQEMLAQQYAALGFRETEKMNAGLEAERVEEEEAVQEETEQERDNEGIPQGLEGVA